MTNKIYIASYDMGAVLTVIDGASNSTTNFAVGTYADAIAVNSVTNQIYAVSELCDCVTVIDGASNLATARLAVGTDPVALAVNPVTNKIYVASSGSRYVTVIDGSTNDTTDVPAGSFPTFVAVDSVTNKIYATNYTDGTMTVIDGASNNTTTISVGGGPLEVALNQATNKIYVANSYLNMVTVIDGLTYNTTSIATGKYPDALAVDAVTNKIYAANFSDGSVTVIDGASNATATVPVGTQPVSLAIDPVTHYVYVTNQGSSNVTVINGFTDATTTLAVGGGPNSIAVNPVTNEIYVTNNYANTVSVIAGAAANPLQFVSLTPCRLVDTRLATGPFGGPAMAGGSSREFDLPNASCGVPSSALAYSLNVTVVPDASLGYLTMWPSGQTQPLVSTLNSDGRVKANAAIVPAGTNGGVDVYVSDPTQVILDINGYFVAVGTPAASFYPLTPCRVADTRNSTNPLGGPFLAGGRARSFPILSSACQIPSTAQAYSLNLTVVPHVALGYLAVWPAGQSQPLVSTLNTSRAVVTANAAIVPAGTSGEVAVLASNDTDLVIDVNGYFASPGNGGLSLYPIAPCRVLDTRLPGSGGAFTGTIAVPVGGGSCGVPTMAEGYVLNATAVPESGLGYLSMWPNGLAQPLVSTLNAPDGAVTSNMALVPASNGIVDVFASSPVQLILDFSGYFAP